MPTATITYAPLIGIGLPPAGTYIGKCRVQAEDATWIPTTLSQNSSPILIAPIKSLTGGLYRISLHFVRFNTGSLIGTTITAANLLLYRNVHIDADAVYSLLIDYNSKWGRPDINSGSDVQSSEWVNTIPTSIITPVRINAFSVGAYHTLALNDLSGINKSGYTGFRLGLDNPNSDAAPTGSNYVEFELDNQPPKLEITYTDGPDVPTTAYQVPPLRSV